MYGGVGLSLSLLLLAIVLFQLIAEPYIEDLTLRLLIVCIGFVVTFPSIVAGYGLLKTKNWARPLGVVAAVFAFVNFPFGTAVSIYSFCLLFTKTANCAGGD
jgi:hypothetical protein